MPAIEIHGKVYESVLLDDVSLRDILLFNAQAAAIGYPERWDDIRKSARELAQLDDDAQAQDHPAMPMVFAANVWAARRASGEDISLGDAIDVPPSEIRVFVDEESEPGKPPARKGAKKSAKPKPSGSDLADEMAATSE